MRTKDEILECARDDITNPHYGDKAAFWLEYRKIEVLVDIRDILAADMKTSIAISEAMSKKH